MIDFMALKGINMPLAITGLEAVWYNTLLKFGFDDQEAREFLCGPAYLAWQWMTNMEGVARPEYVSAHTLCHQLQSDLGRHL